MLKGHIDAAARGAFLSLTIDGATALIEKMVANQSRGGKKTTKRHAYHEGGGYACRKNGFVVEETGREGP